MAIKITRIIQYLLLSASVAACSSASKLDLSSKGLVTNYLECSLPKDQGPGSLLGKWSTRPIPLVFDQDFYISNSGAALPSLRKAVATWNAWSSLKGFQAFTIINDVSGISGGAHIPRDLGTLASCSQAAYTSSYTSAVGVWKIQSSGDGINTRASCGSQLKLLSDGTEGTTDWIFANGQITGASILLNFDNFNTPGKVNLDLESLLLHELGHVLGLLHSCNGSGGADTDATSAINCSLAPVSYLGAVMFPALFIGQVRRALTQNDYGRINCLY